MFCPLCHSTLADGVTLCQNCRRNLYTYEPPANNAQGAPLTSLEREKQRKAKHYLRISTVIIYILLLITVCSLTWLMVQMIKARQELVADDITILTATLTMVGTFYLAYDLLGRQRGPLFWVSLVVTSGWIGGLTPAPLIMILLLGYSPMIATRFVLINILQGAFAGLVFGLNRSTHSNKMFSPRKAFLGVVLSIPFWTAFFYLFFTEPFSNMWRYIPVFFLFLGVPIGLLVGGFHRFFLGKVVLNTQRPKVFSWAHFFKASLIFIPMWFLLPLVINMVVGGPQPGYWIIGYSLLLSLSGLVPSGFAEHICWWLDQRPPRVLGAIGLVLVLTGALVSMVPPIAHILSALHIK